MQNEKVLNPLGEAPIGRLMVQFAVPSIIAMLVGAIYNIVDQFFIGQSHVDSPFGDIDFDDITILNLSDITSGCCFGRDMPDAESRCTSTETAVGYQRTLLAQVARFDIRGRIKHFLHTGTSLRTLVRDDDYISADNFSSEYPIAGCFL